MGFRVSDQLMHILLIGWCWDSKGDVWGINIINFLVPAALWPLCLWSAVFIWWESGFCKNNLGIWIKCCYLCLSGRNQRSCDCYVADLLFKLSPVSWPSSYTCYNMFTLSKSLIQTCEIQGEPEAFTFMETGYLKRQGTWRACIPERILKGPAWFQGRYFHGFWIKHPCVSGEAAFSAWCASPIRFKCFSQFL